MSREVIRFDSGLNPVLKHQQGKHNQRSHGSWAEDPSLSYAEQAAKYEQENLEYIFGRTIFPPAWSGPQMTVFVPPTTLKDKLRSAGKRLKKWNRERERKAIDRLSPEELAEIGRENQRRVAKRERESKRDYKRKPSSWEGPLPTTWENPYPLPQLAKSLRGVIPSLRKVFGEIVDVEIWDLLEDNSLDLDELGGVLGDVVDQMLGLLAPTSVVLKFSPSLRPVLKHEGGGHDQKTHGSWAHGSRDFSAWGARAARIEAARDWMVDEYGVNKFDVVRRHLSGDAYEDYKVLYLDDRRTEIESMSDEEAISEFEAYGSMRVPDFTISEAEFARRELLSLAEIEAKDFAEERIAEDWIGMAEAFNEVYEVEVPTEIGGEPGMMYSAVNDVDFYSDRVRVTGSIYNDDLDFVGEFARTFSLSRQGEIEVENVLLKIHDPEYRGYGFASKFNERSYDFYISQGIERVTVGTAWDGGYVWGLRGFEWNPDTPETNYRVAYDSLSKISKGGVGSNGFPWSDETRADAAAYLEELESSRDDINGWPTPMEIAYVGWSENADTWAGKDALTDARWKGQKILTPEATAKILEEKNRLRQTKGQGKLFKAKEKTYYEKMAEYQNFVESYSAENGFSIDFEDDPEQLNAFMIAAAEAMPWLVKKKT